jgi:hypothetical protein
MSKRKRRHGYKFTRLAGESLESIQTIIRITFGELLTKDVRQWVKENGRGVVLIHFLDDTIGSIQPPSYVESSGWNSAPPLIDEAVKTEIDNAIVSYAPEKEYLILIFSVEGDYEGSYAWWKESFPKLPGVIDLWKR